jgi:hypothetical protein
MIEVDMDASHPSTPNQVMARTSALLGILALVATAPGWLSTAIFTKLGYFSDIAFIFNPAAFILGLCAITLAFLSMKSNEKINDKVYFPTLLGIIFSIFCFISLALYLYAGYFIPRAMIV